MAPAYLFLLANSPAYAISLRQISIVCSSISVQKKCEKLVLCEEIQAFGEFQCQHGGFRWIPHVKMTIILRFRG